MRGGNQMLHFIMVFGVSYLAYQVVKRIFRGR